METGSRIKSVCVIVGGLGLGLFIASGGQAQVIHPDQMIGVPSPQTEIDVYKRQVLRDYLKASPYVVTFRPGDRAEGGDGVTIVELR